MDELSYLLTVSKHPRTLKLLQDALDQAKGFSPEERRNGDGTEIHVTDNGNKTTTIASPHSENATVKVSGHTKPPTTTWSATRITDYGNLWSNCICHFYC